MQVASFIEVYKLGSCAVLCCGVRLATYQSFSMLRSLFCCLHNHNPLKLDDGTRPLLRCDSEPTRWDRRWGPRGRGSLRRKRYVELPSPAFSRLDDDEPPVIFSRVRECFLRLWCLSSTTFEFKPSSPDSYLRYALSAFCCLFQVSNAVL
jgi:hypothetical protein